MTVTLKTDDQIDRFKTMIEKHIKIGSYKLKSGEYSDKYFDIKSLFCNGSFAFYAAKCIELPDDIKYVGGMESGATQFATALSISYKYLPSFIIRKQAKSYGIGGLVVSYVDQMVGKCCIIDDVVTTGSSIDQCVDILKSEGHDLEVDSVVCIVDRTKGKYTRFPIVSFFKEEDFKVY